jgi:hypothetical protein
MYQRSFFFPRGDDGYAYGELFSIHGRIKLAAWPPKLLKARRNICKVKGFPQAFFQEQRNAAYQKRRGKFSLSQVDRIPDCIVKWSCGSVIELRTGFHNGKKIMGS